MANSDRIVSLYCRPPEWTVSHVAQEAASLQRDPQPGANQSLRLSACFCAPFTPSAHKLDSLHLLLCLCGCIQSPRFCTVNCLVAYGPKFWKKWTS